MTDFRKLLHTLESINQELMEVNDSFDLELNDELVIETGIVGFTEDGVIVEADDAALELLEKNGAILNEETDWSKYDKPTIARIKSGETEPVDRTDYDVPPGMRKDIKGKTGPELRREKLKQMGALKNLDKKMDEGDELAEIKHLSGLKEGSRAAVEDAIKYRIMRQHVDLLKDHGVEKVLAAIEDTASGLDDLEEIGTSDVSIWVDQIKKDLDSGMYDGVKETKEEDVSDLAKMKEKLLTMIKAQRESGNEKAAAELEGMLKQKFPHQQDMKEDKKKISGNKEWVVTGTWTHRKYQREPFTIDTKVRAKTPEEAMRKYKSWMWDKYERKVIDMKVKPYTGQAVTLGGPDAGKEAPVVAEGKQVNEAEYQGRKVPLGKPMRGDTKKFKVYVRKPNGKVVKVNFGDKKMRIKKSNPKRRKSFRARHRCENPGPRWKARYWSCRKW